MSSEVASKVGKVTLVYVWLSPSGRYFAYAPEKFGYSAKTLEKALDDLRKETKAPLRFIESTPPELSR